MSRLNIPSYHKPTQDLLTSREQSQSTRLVCCEDQRAAVPPGNVKMEAPDHSEMNSPPHKLPPQETADRRITSSSELGQAHGSQQPSTIRHFVYKFLLNVKSRFGEGSPEVVSIWDALGEFRAGRMSKKDALTAINLALSHHNDLKQDLMNVLHHPEAEWQEDDFEVEPHQPGHPAIPHCLQPVHQPRIRVPFILPSEDRQVCEPNSLSYNQAQSPAIIKSTTDHTQSLAVTYPGITARRLESHSPRSAFRETSASDIASPSAFGDPMSVPADTLVEDMPPASKKRRREAFGNQSSQHVIVDKHTWSAVPELPWSKAKQSQNEDASKPYIHSLCGRGFSSRSKVKKHHWGNVLDNLETKTGCWAKHGKPNISWNEHPSCRERDRVSSHARTATPVTTREDESQQNPQTLPDMVSPIQDLPVAVAYMYPIHEEHQDAPQVTVQYDSHRVLHRSSFDSLLSAVNMASQIDAPQPQGRMDSVVSQIDAQAAAAEYSSQYVTDWQNTLGGYDGQAIDCGYYHPYTAANPSIAYPPRGYHVPLEMTLPFYGRPQAHTPHMYAPATGNWIDDPSSMLEEHNSRAPLEPLFPDPHVGSRRVRDT